jgi:hypothetical protein
MNSCGGTNTTARQYSIPKLRTMIEASSEVYTFVVVENWTLIT